MFQKPIEINHFLFCFSLFHVLPIQNQVVSSDFCTITLNATKESAIRILQVHFAYVLCLTLSLATL